MSKQRKGRRYWLYGGLIALFSLALYNFVPLFVPNYHPCSLPSLVSVIPSTTLEEIGTSGYFEDRCPAPISSVMEFERPYGIIRMRLWGSPHRLYMVGTTVEGEPLEFSGPRVERFQTTRPDSFLAEYSNRVTFSGHTYIESISERFTLDVLAGEVLLETLEFQYVPISCMCPESELSI